MIQIAVCDDDKREVKGLKKRLAEYESNSDVSFQTSFYDKPEELLRDLEDSAACEIYLLDILMPGVSGIEIGRKIREKNENAVIIYVTSSPDFALDAFGVFAQRYLLKPVKEEDFRKVMDYAVMCSKQVPRFFSVKTSDGQQMFMYDDIEFIENKSRAIHIHTREGQEIKSKFIRQSFESLMQDVLLENNFIQVHKSYIINMEYVQVYSYNQLTMQSGELIPVSRNRQVEVKRKYLQYMSDNRR